MATSYYPDGRVYVASLPAQAGASSNPGTTFTYDDVTGIVTALSADGVRTQTVTVVQVGDAWRLASTVVDEENRTTVATHAGLGAPDRAPVVSLADGLGQVWQYAYDMAGQLTQVTGPPIAPSTTPVTRTWTYENLTGRLLSETHPESGTVQLQEHWPSGALKRKTDAKGAQFDYAYDANGRLASVTTTFGGQSESTTYTYEDGSDRLATTTAPGLTTVLTYTTTGLLEQRTDTVEGKPFVGTYAYDGLDRLAAITYPSGRVVRYGYDGAESPRIWPRSRWPSLRAPPMVRGRTAAGIINCRTPGRSGGTTATTTTTISDRTRTTWGWAPCRSMCPSRFPRRSPCRSRSRRVAEGARPRSLSLSTPTWAARAVFTGPRSTSVTRGPRPVSPP